MNREPHNDANDPVWELLRQSPRRQAGPRFVDDTLRAARLAGRPEPWWHRLRVPLSLGGLATAALAVFLITRQPDAGPTTPAPQIAAESLEVLDDLVRTEALSVVADYPAEFTDAELVSLLVY